MPSLFDLSRAFQIFAKYFPRENHGDTLWAGVDQSVNVAVHPSIVSEEDKEELKELGWIPDEYGNFMLERDA